jgi:hypothetical protein
VSRWVPCKRIRFIRRLRGLGFDDPFSGSRHQFMLHGNHRLTRPSNDEYSIPQPRMMMREVEDIIERRITLDEWRRL